VDNAGVGQWLARWRTWDPRLLWVGLVDVVAAVAVIRVLLSRHHSAVVIALTVLVAVALLSLISVPEVNRVRRRQAAAREHPSPETSPD
jgi:hypothetical protein